MATSDFRDLTPLLNPRAVAVVGASERPASPGRLVLENLRHLGYPGKVYPVHPTHRTILGLPCYPDLRSLPGPVDSVAILLGADKALHVLGEAAEVGASAAWVLAAGFGEAGPEGMAREQTLRRIAHESGLLVSGPNCIGVANLVDRAATYSVALSPKTHPGQVSAVVQSGAICLGLANSARFGFRYLISSGNEAVLDSADYIGHLAHDPHTRVILAFLEGIRHPAKFAAAALAAARAKKPVLVVKVGRSAAARRAVRAHTGSLAGSDRVIDAVFQRLGVIRLQTLNELIEVAELFATSPLPRGDGVGLLSLSGGQIGLIADLAEELELTFPPFSEEARRSLETILPSFSPIANPLDAWGSGDLEATYPVCVDVVSRQDEIHLLAVSRGTPEGIAEREVEQSLAVVNAAVRAQAETGKPVVIFSNFSAGFQPQVRRVAEQGGVAYLQGTAESLRAIKAFVDFAAFARAEPKKVARGCPSPSELSRWRERLADMEGALSEVEARQLLVDYGIQAPAERSATRADEAVEAAAALGYPVVLKILSPQIQHKTEVDGVRVGLPDDAAVRTAFHQVIESARCHRPEAELEGVLIQEQVSEDAVQVIVGVLQDPDFGPVIVFGTGGLLVELLQDTTLRLPPLSRDEATGMIEETRAARLLKGFRGKPPSDVDALVDALVRVSQLAVDLEDRIVALEINPMMVMPDGQGVRAVDALVEV